MDPIVYWAFLAIGAILFILRYGIFFLSLFEQLKNENTLTRIFEHTDLFQKLMAIYLIVISPITALV
ncbi:MAG: hypothetical protein KatS3mg084_0345 [Candidatus Dojkabacteria bacterium]|nr:MAG: hypothetical protein KatS3mg084_0345 [Candidatus Dojkabacteria bacterium]